MIDEIKEKYSSLKDRDWFPRFGESNSSGSKGYGVGPINNKPLSELYLLYSLASRRHIRCFLLLLGSYEFSYI